MCTKSRNFLCVSVVDKHMENCLNGQINGSRRRVYREVRSFIFPRSVVILLFCYVVQPAFLHSNANVKINLHLQTKIVNKT